MCGGGSCGGTPTTTTTSSAPPAWGQQALQELSAQNQGISDIYLAPGQQVPQLGFAGINPYQANAFQTIMNAPAVASPYLSEANNEFNAGAALTSAAAPYMAADTTTQQAAAGPIWAGAGTLANKGLTNFGSELGSYMSPYTQDVVNATQAQFNNQNAIQSNSLLGSAIQAGNAFGGDREGVAQAQLAGQQQLAQAPVIAGLYNTGYQTALGAAETQNQQAIQAGLGQVQAGLGIGQLGQNIGNVGLGIGTLGSELAGIGSQTGGMGLGAGGLNISAGGTGFGAATTMQQIQQMQQNIAYQNAMAQFGLPAQAESWLEGVEVPTIATSGGQSTASTTPGFNTASTLSGLGILGLGAAALLRRGGRVPHRQMGGGGLEGTGLGNPFGGGIAPNDLGVGGPLNSVFGAPTNLQGGMGIPKPLIPTVPDPMQSVNQFSQALGQANKLGVFGSQAATPGQSPTLGDQVNDFIDDNNPFDSSNIASTPDANISLSDSLMAKDGGVVGYDIGGAVDDDTAGLAPPPTTGMSPVGYYAMEAPLVGEQGAESRIAASLDPLKDGGIVGYDDGGDVNADTQEEVPAPEAPKLINRDRFRAELEQNPQLRDKMMRIMANEQGSHPEGTQAIAESAMNRAEVRGTPLEQQLRWHNAEPGGYYQMGSMGRGALEDPSHHKILSDALDRALYGSNISNYATDNASGAFAAGEERRGEFLPRNKINGETFFSPGSAEPGLAAKYGDWRQETPSGVAGTSALALAEPDTGLGATKEQAAINNQMQPQRVAQAQPEGFMDKLGHIFNPPANETPEQHDRRTNAALALMSAGAGMMAGQSPHAFQNIGAGAQVGLHTYMTADKLSRESQLLQSRINHENAMEKRWEAEATFRKQQLNKPQYHTMHGEYGDYLIETRPDGTVRRVELPQAPETSNIPAGAPAPSHPDFASPKSGFIKVSEEDKNGLPVSGVFHNENRTDVNEEALSDPRFHLTEEEKNQVKAMAEGRIKLPPQSRNNPQNKRLRDALFAYDPSADETSFGRRQKTENFFAVGTQGGGGQNIASMNTWGQHMNDYLALTKKLQMGEFRNLNEIKGWLYDHGIVGSNEVRDAYGALQVAQKAVADEGAKAMAGSNSALADREEWLRRFDTNQPFHVQLAKAKEVANLIGGRLASLAQQYNEGMRTNHDMRDLIAPRTREVFGRILGSTGNYEPVDYSGTGAEKPKTEEKKAAVIPEPKEREVGKVYDTPKGKLKWTGTGWVQP